MQYSLIDDYSFLDNRMSIAVVPVKDFSITEIDFDFFNKALQEVYQLYPQYKHQKFEITKFLQLVLKQSDIYRPDYQIPVNFVFSEKSTVYNSTNNLTLDQ